jgi:hypothetical protein
MSMHDKDVSHKEEFNVTEEEDFPVDTEAIAQKYIQVPLNLNDTKIKNKLTKDDLYKAIIELHLQKEASDKRVRDLENLQLKKDNNSEDDNVSDEYRFNSRGSLSRYSYQLLHFKSGCLFKTFRRI